MKKIVVPVIALVVAGLAAATWFTGGPAPTGGASVGGPPPHTATPIPQQPLRVLHIMSYDTDWVEWTVWQLESFKHVLRDLPVEYRVIEMDVRRNTSEDWKRQITQHCHDVIRDWKPDLVYTSDDFVQSSVVSRYLESDLPFVFSGVNAHPSIYGFDKAANVTGVLEREHIAQTARLLTTLVPTAKRLAVISDTGETWPAVIQRIRESEDEMGMTVVAADRVATFAEYQETIRSYEGRADAVVTLGIFNFEDESGKNVPQEQVGRWTLENSNLPNVSFWDSRPVIGALCVVAVSGRAQGETAGEIARQILVDGKSPSEIPILPTHRGQPIINLEVARRLGINPPSTLLLTAKVVERCKWE